MWKDGNSTAVLEVIRKYGELDNGGKAAVRRVSTPDDLLELGVFYRILPDDAEERSLRQWARIVFLLPYLGHARGRSIGSVLANGDIREQRIAFITKSDDPRCFEYLRKAARRIWNESREDALVDWTEFAPMLFFWGESRKKDLVRSYYMALKKKD